MAFLLYSCASKEKDIVGTWDLVEIHEGNHPARHGLYGRWAFTSNGQYQIEYDKDGIRYAGTYTFDGSILALNRTDGTEESLEVDRLDQSRLILWVAGDTRNIFRKEQAEQGVPPLRRTTCAEGEH